MAQLLFEMVIGILFHVIRINIKLVIKIIIKLVIKYYYKDHGTGYF